jgi:small GTP-binding protein
MGNNTSQTKSSSLKKQIGGSLTEQDLDSAPSKRSYTEEEENQTNEESWGNCPVCLESYNTEKHLRIPLDCSHAICKDCFQSLKEYKHIGCPLCRKELSSKIIQDHTKSLNATKSTDDEMRPIQNELGSCMDDHDYMFKYLIVGDKKTGKSSLLTRYAQESFEETYNPTNGAEFKLKLFAHDNKRVKVQAWSIANDEKFTAITKCLCPTTKGIILCFDTTNRESFENLPKWFSAMKKHAKQAKIILVGTKSDLKYQRIVSYDEARAWALSHKMSYVEVSSKGGSNVEETFLSLTKEICDYQHKEKVSTSLFKKRSLRS